MDTEHNNYQILDIVLQEIRGKNLQKELTSGVAVYKSAEVW